MSMVRRMGRLISANFHSLADRWEDPHAVLQQAVRDSEHRLREVMDEAAQLMACEKLLSRQLAEQELLAGRCRARAAEALRDGDEELCRSWLRQRREYKQAAKELAAEVASTRTAVHHIKARLESLQHQQARERRRVVVLRARHTAAAVRYQLAQQALLASEPVGDDGYREDMQRVELAIAHQEARAELFEISSRLAVSTTALAAGDDLADELDLLRNELSAPAKAEQ
ncbi:MAG: PspA/IM30 family protein [Pirellulaceae bacterium]